MSPITCRTCKRARNARANSWPYRNAALEAGPKSVATRISLGASIGVSIGRPPIEGGRPGRASVGDVRMTSLEVIDFSSGAVASPAVPLLNAADQLLRAAVDLIQIVVRQLAPLDLGFTLHLVPHA